MSPSDDFPVSKQDLEDAISFECKELEQTYLWLEKHLPPSFFEEVDFKKRLIVAKSLMNFNLQGKFVNIRLKTMAIVLCPDTPDVDLKILKTYVGHVIRYYRAFVSDVPPAGEEDLLRIAILYLQDDPKEDRDPSFAIEPERREELIQLIQARNKEFHATDLETLLHGMTPRFVRSLKNGRLALALDMFFRAKKSDECQYEIRQNPDWKEKKLPSLQIVLAWRAVPKSGFLYRLAKIMLAHSLNLTRVVATYINPYSEENILLLSIGVHGIHEKPAWEETDLDDFLRELCLIKYFDTEDAIAETFVQTKMLSGNEAHLVRNIVSFAHQALLHADPYLYSYANVLDGLCRHPELTVKLCKVFETKFDPKKHDQKAYLVKREEMLDLIDKLDTGQAANDRRRKNILKFALDFIDYTLKTNFYGHNKSGFSFRLDPAYLDALPFERKDKFPALPFGIFFIRGMYFIGFNIRFKDLARGGVRTVMPDREETYNHERNNIFAEAYNLSYTQHKKNKDIPEGGAKTVILLEPLEVLAQEDALFQQEMEQAGMDAAIIQERIKISRRKHKTAILFAAQRSFIECFMTLLNCDSHGMLKAKYVIDFWKKPEYIYLGPDENMLNEMIVWIADFAERVGYRPGRSFMSSKPGAGINHKEYGVTSYGVNVYLHQTLLFLGIDPEKEPFTIKISGGPDGDVAGNEIHILATCYPKTAKLLALTDVSGTIFDPEGLDWHEMDTLFQEGNPIRFYPPEKLHEGGFLLDLQTKRQESAFVQQTLLWRKANGQTVQEWLAGNDMNHLFRSNVHQVEADVFVPGGGRPRTLNELNVSTFINESGKPTAKAIVEGANLYLTPEARRYLEKLGTVVLKDSSCNKGGVICSSFEVLAGLCMTEEEFIREKPEYVKEVLQMIHKAAFNEANLILETHRKTGAFFTDLSEKVSEKINLYKYQLLDHLEELELPKDPNDPLIKCLFLYCPQILRKKYRDQVLNMPEIHKKAIISVFLASHLVYHRGLEWSPSVADILSNIATDPKIIGD